jgi:hypothetical protein
MSTRLVQRSSGSSSLRSTLTSATGKIRLGTPRRPSGPRGTASPWSADSIPRSVRTNIQAGSRILSAARAADAVVRRGPPPLRARSGSRGPERRLPAPTWARPARRSRTTRRAQRCTSARAPKASPPAARRGARRGALNVTTRISRRRPQGCDEASQPPAVRYARSFIRGYPAAAWNQRSLCAATISCNGGRKGHLLHRRAYQGNVAQHRAKEC